VIIPHSKTKVPLLLFCHGFKGFKDWGHFNWMANWFAENGIAFCKFNFSHSGVNPDSPDDISDFELFGNNNYSKELEDIGHVITWLKNQSYATQLDFNNLTIAGHSRGGSIAFIRAVSDERIKQVVLWASPFDLLKYFRPETIALWEKEGKVQVENKRTGHVYPLYKQFYDDFQKNKSAFDMTKLCEKFSKPLLILHGTHDQTVPFSEAKDFFEHVPHSILIPVEGADHTFGVKHPFNESDTLTNHLMDVFENTLEFILD
jgi:uncharacterized protein